MIKLEKGKILAQKQIQIEGKEFRKVCFITENDFSISYITEKDYQQIKDIKEILLCKNEKGQYKPVE